MTFDIIEEGTPCDFCGKPVEFFDDDWTVCPNCHAEYSSMDYIHGDIHEDLEELN
jgi:predicted amidophosphoribosyltransferase